VAPEIAVLDFGMPRLNGVDAAREIQRRAPGTRTIVLTMFEDAAYVLGALEAGVRGYVLKAQAAADLMRAIDEVLRGAIYLSPGISRVVVDAYLNKRTAVSGPLTDRERHILQLVAEGRSSKEIAFELGIGFKTVESHRTSIMHKLDIHNTAGLVRYAIRRGLVRA
jgi:DNA-binding NarL/FixJ family response regulator